MKTNVVATNNLQKSAKEIRKTILDIAYKTHTGHIAPALSVVDILNVLYTHFLKPKVDLFILSKGHAALALYIILARHKYLTLKEVETYCQNGGVIGVHPEHNPGLGVEFTTGSLGHGLSVAVGAALGLRFDKKSGRVFVLVSDAELNEGSVWEGIMFAGHHQLHNLTMIIDNNGLQAFGRTSDVLNLHPLENKFRDFNWNVIQVDGHDYASLLDAFETNNSQKPTVIIANTIGGKGVSFMEDKVEWHYNNLDEKLYKQAIEKL